NPQDRDNAFVLVPDVKLYGGFDPDAGITEIGHTRVLPGKDNASPTHSTVLSGDIDNNNTLDNGNSYHVVISAGDVGGAVLDGFVITEGYTDGTGNSTVNTLSLLRSHGAGMYIHTSSPTLTNVSIKGNTA